ncbi:hypothetical protein LEMA_P086890.1 [Plenodomus lingam JN3]|uniref:Centromere protein X n=1 Tax=Leptosphaeria maculans (strain JN3 / isolate v23.1.3 / race Av1-4-5-6-7-8) TaxID=985895 RepID=E5A755_LEPMJ|nr:hypothetical protein LEMA_P086890.1 [Plenodomus lingam JN3]CBX99450.1 hypothetical protein LEMA_P086890.1 [Plenodomus lingam JN3]
MPPKNATTGASRRGGPQFKPPRPIKAPTAQTTTAKRGPAAPKKVAAPTSRAETQPQPTVILSSGDEQDEFDDDIDMDSDDLMQDAPMRPTTARPPAASFASASPSIPAPLLARLLYENFENEQTQIQKGAMNLVGKYLDIFVREAFARAKHERELAVKGGGISDGFLQVEDLEKLAPQLVLDF